MVDLLPARRRKGVRRSVRSACRAMSWSRFEVVGERLRDLSPYGALLECEGEVVVGDQLLVSFRMPWLGDDVLVTAEVARVVAGRRTGDRGRCAGLRFVDLDPADRRELRARLEPLEPTPAARVHPVDYALTASAIAHRTTDDPGILE